MRRSTLGLLLPLLLLLPPPSKAQDAADPGLLSEINGIRAVDNHAHVMSVAGREGRARRSWRGWFCARTRSGSTACRGNVFNSQGGF